MGGNAAGMAAMRWKLGLRAEARFSEAQAFELAAGSDGWNRGHVNLQIRSAEATEQGCNQ